MKRKLTQIWMIAVLAASASGCASQYYHPIKKTAEFYEDLDYCEAAADRQGMDVKTASRDRLVDQCLTQLGWRNKENTCFSSRLGSRMPASEPCRKDY